MPKPHSALFQWRRKLRDKRRALTWAAKNRIDHHLLAGPLERLTLARRRAQAAHAAHTPHTLYVDLSVIAKSDAGTGIQRVVRSIYACLAEQCPPAITLTPLYTPILKRGYRSALDEPIGPGQGAIFLGLDFATDNIHRQRKALEQFVHSGGQAWFILHDILPLSHPQWFTHASQLHYRRWLRACLQLATGIICVSPEVAQQLHGLMTERFALRHPPRIATITLGAQISQAPADTTALPIRPGLDAQTWARAALLVGTLEPRKGHGDVLDAFELLWQRGAAIPLVLIGRRGWNMAALEQRILHHPQLGRLLFWLDDVDDKGLLAAYHSCRLTLVPSLAEGYGLPLDEALACGSPVLARDIAVFRRHEGANIAYFAADADPATLAEAIAAGHAGARRGARPMREIPWSQTTAQLLEIIGCTAGGPPPVT